MRRLLVVALFLSSFPASARAAGSVTPEMDAQVIKSLESIYRMEFDKAEAEITVLQKMNPDHPFAYFGFTALAWVRYVYESEQTDQTLLEPFEESVTLALKKAEAWIKKHPDDAEAYMTLGAAHGVYARLLALRRKWIRAYLHARRAMKSVRKAVDIDPELHDAWVGIGMYDYYTDLYPHFIGVLSKLVLRGNRKRGINILRRAAEKGKYMKVAAEMLLVEIYTHDPFGNRNGEAAIEIMKSIRTRYPTSQMFHSAQLISLYEGKRYEEFKNSAQEFVRLSVEGVYRPHDRAKGYVFLGTALLNAGKEKDALEAFRSGSNVMLGGNLSRWSVWALIRVGHLEDMRGRRDQALAAYRKAAKIPDHWDYRKLAKKNLKRPFKPGKVPYSIEPK